ncbi:phosphatase PAP2 family protein [Actinoplanes auranticolor]|uniref:Inositolphosphotransferase Aur1/Ipt1 domain-containing protein n=1 Tax=Actinoplanes auranticolor TaxID=47988 RepID=A0A919VJS5_9ACTN|nr:phosphatase PAP2 family protein [Actinoplanes auranticolor]GIM68646.1 hypothetical protein Aau02nite_32640 [Actinoplanes auranticolor]
MTLADDRPAPAPVAVPRTRPAPLRELALIAALWAAYSLGRLAADGHVATATANASRVWDLERLLRLPGETGLQHLLLRSGAVIEAANSYYAYVHFPATIAFLLWVYLRRPGHYRPVRNTLALLTGTALAVHLIFPLAPPRMLAATGLIDTGRLFGPSVYGSPATDSVTNQYAAMPSLHVGWSLLVACTLLRLTRGRWRRLWLLHPVLTLLVVVGTANHYWIDAAVAAALLAAAMRLTGLGLVRPGPARSSLSPPSPAPLIPAPRHSPHVRELTSHGPIRRSPTRPRATRPGPARRGPGPRGPIPHGRTPRT